MKGLMMEWTGYRPEARAGNLCAGPPSDHGSS
jgi:hypothetical protein